MIKNIFFSLVLLSFGYNNASEPRKELPFLKPKISSCKYTESVDAMRPEAVIGLSNAQFLKDKRESLLKDIDGDKTRHWLDVIDLKKDLLKVIVDFCCVERPNIIDTVLVSDHNTMTRFSYRNSALSLMPPLDQVDKIDFISDEAKKSTNDCILVRDKHDRVHSTGIELLLGAPTTGVKTWARVAVLRYDTFHPIREKLHHISSETLVEHCKGCHVLKDFTALSKCARCEKAFYCNRDCQAVDWRSGHKFVCRK